MAILIGVVAVLGAIILVLAGLLFFGDRLRGSPATTASATATTVVAAVLSPTNPIATAIVTIAPSPAVAPSPTLAPPTLPTAAPPATVAPTAPPKPTGAPATATPAAALPAVAITQMGIRVSPPAGWQRQDDITGSKNGTVSFYQPGTDKRSYHFNRNGLFVIGRRPLTMGAVPAEDYLMGFEDGMVMEFVTLIGSGPDVTDEPLRKVQLAGRSGQTTTVTIRNSSTTLRYLWWDLSTPTEALNIFCGAEDSQWQRVQPLCNQTIQSLSLTN
jgi:hypothetical protein